MFVVKSEDTNEAAKFVIIFEDIDVELLPSVSVAKQEALIAEILINGLSDDQMEKENV